MKLIVGLGNPGRKYENSRHNLGYRVVKALAGELDCYFGREIRFKSFIAEVQLGGNLIILALPATFMNLSGKAVRTIKIEKNITLSNMVIVSDDVHLDFGVIRIKRKGSGGGHKGLESIIKELMTSEFCRLRIGVKGIGSSVRRFNLSRYVLSNFTKTEEMQLDSVVVNAVECLKVWVSEGCNEAMNRFNR